ncbi:MAG: hypothetical protein ABJE95_04910 [Byssovorax sp.]
MTSDDIRDHVVAYARSLVGVSANPASAESRQQYLDLIAPGESEAQQRTLADLSGCGLVVAGIWRELGVTAPEIEPPYRKETAISRLIAIARHAGAWVAFSADNRPSPGDAVLVGDGPGETEHVYTVISVTDDGASIVVESIDGGQRDAAHQETILAKQRVWRGRKDIVFAGSDPGAASAAGRTITGWIDVTRLPIAAADAEAPELAAEVA